MDRTKAGLARARAFGKVIGRPEGYERWEPVLEAVVADGYGKKRMSRTVTVPMTFVAPVMSTVFEVVIPVPPVI